MEFPIVMINEINSEIIEGQIRPIIEKLAYKNHLEVIDLHNLFGDDWQEHLFPDKLHPSSIGAGMMAKKIFEYLSSSSYDDFSNDRMQ